MKKPPVRLFCGLLLGSLLTVSSLLTMSTASAQEIQIAGGANSRYVTTMGTSEINAPPDMVSVTLGVANWDKNLRIAYSENARRTKAILDLKDKYHVEAKDVQTTQLEVEPTYPDTGSFGRFQLAKPTGYAVHQLLTFTLHDVGQLPLFIADTFESGANTVQNVRYDITTSRTLKDQSRDKALLAAKEKAAAASEKLGAKIGKAIIVKELGSTAEPASNYMAMQSRASSNSFAEAQMSSVDAASSTAPGSIKINTCVMVTFEMLE